MNAIDPQVLIQQCEKYIKLHGKDTPLTLDHLRRIIVATDVEQRSTDAHRSFVESLRPNLNVTDARK